VLAEILRGAGYGGTLSQSGLPAGSPSSFEKVGHGKSQAFGYPDAGSSSCRAKSRNAEAEAKAKKELTQQRKFTQAGHRVFASSDCVLRPACVVRCRRILAVRIAHAAGRQTFPIEYVH